MNMKGHTKTLALVVMLIVSYPSNAQNDIEELLDRLKPELFEPGIISTGEFEYGSSLSEDENTFAFVKAIRGFERSVLVYSNKENGKWSRPEVFPFSGKWHDTNPYFQGNDTLYFTSRRPTDEEGVTGSNLWVSVRIDGQFQEPELLKSFNDQHSVIYPTIDSQKSVWFSSVRPGGKGGLDLFVSKWGGESYLEPEAIDYLNTSGHDADPEISPDGNMLVFTSTREGGLGHFDLYLCLKNSDGSWSNPINLGKSVNSPYMDSDPIFSKDGKYLFFSSDRIEITDHYDPPITSYEQLTQKVNGIDNGLMNIYVMDVSLLLEYVINSIEN